MPARKRARAAGSPLTAKQKAQIANYKFSKGLPWGEYGAMRVKRGTDENIERFGATYKDASADQKARRAEARYTGRGMYTGRGSYFGRALGSAVGAVAGRAMPIPGVDGAQLGGFLGSKAGNYLGMGMYTGRGKYNQTNELMGGSVNASPSFVSVPDESGSLIVAHKEYIGDIFAPATADVSDFVVQSFPINPGLEQTFPWLSQIAQNYEEYELIQCVFEFTSTVQDINSTNGQVGTIIAATNYNPSAALFNDKPSMAAYAHSVSGKSTDNVISGVECDPDKVSGSAGKYIRANPVLTGEDLKSYDHGKFQLATHNIPVAMASGTLGELYVVYTVKLRKPKFFTGRGLGLTRFMTVCKDNISKLYPFGTSTSVQLNAQQNNLAIKVEPQAPNGTQAQTLITWPAYYAGRMRIIMHIESTVAGAGFLGSDRIVAGAAVGGNVELVSDIYGAISGGDSPASGSQQMGAEGGIAILDVRVEPSTNATDNTLLIVSNLIGSGGLVLEGSSIDISEYNSFGSLGAAALVNSAGTVVPN